MMTDYSLHTLFAEIDAACREAPARFKKDAQPAAPVKLAPFEPGNHAMMANTMAHAMRVNKIPHSVISTFPGREETWKKIYPTLLAADPRVADRDVHQDMRNSLGELASMPTTIGKLPKAAQPNPLLPAESRPALEDHEKKALNGYTHHFDALLNGALRKQIPLYHPGVFAAHKSMQSAFAKAKAFAKPVVVHRGWHSEDPAMVKLVVDAAKRSMSSGKPLKFDGYFSTSTKPSNYFINGAAVEYRILARHGIDVKPVSKKPMEDELLLNHGSKIAIRNVSYNERKNQWLIEGEQVVKNGRT